MDDFVNGTGAVLPVSIYNETYLGANGSSAGDKFADALVPYSGEAVTTVTGNSKMFYIEVHSDEDQPAGVYTTEIRLYAGDELLEKINFTATVWNFALPEGHYGDTVCGLYNSSSGYASTRGFLELSGVRFDERGEVIQADIPLAESILEGWQEFLLQHGVTTYEIPRFLIDTDPKAAELTMADPRRSVFAVPLLSLNTYNGELTAAAKAKILQYKDLVYGNKYLKDKAFFYTMDEPKWKSDADAASYDALCAAIEKQWNGYHSVVPFYGTAGSYVGNKVKATSDIMCVNQNLVASDESVLNDFISGSWYKTWRYQGENYLGGFYINRWAKSPMGVFARVLYWQADALNSDGILHWNCGYCPYVDGKPYNVWETGSAHGSKGITTGNGDGVLVYPSAPLGLDAATPIASLRLKHIANGMDDYDYLQLAKEFLGEDSAVYTGAKYKVLDALEKYGIKHIFSCESSLYGEGVAYEWIAWECSTMNSARIALGNALSEASTEHNYGDWDIAVKADEEHNGLEIRICADCGAQESREIYFCSGADHSFKYLSNGGDTHGCICEYCGFTKTEAHSEVALEAVAATCKSEGLTAGVKCSVCGEVLVPQQTTAKTAHSYPEGSDTCSVCGKKCACMCHKDGILGFLYKILSFFRKLFGVNPVCECGKAHY